MHVEPSESHEDTVQEVEMPEQHVPVPSESVEEDTPPAVTSIDTIPGNTCSDTNNTSEKQQETVSEEVQNVSVQHTVASENENKCCNQLNTEDTLESGVQSGEVAGQFIHVPNEIVEELTPPATNTTLSETCGDSKTIPENQQELLPTVTCEDEDISVQHMVVSENEDQSNDNLSSTKDFPESGVHRGGMAGQLMHVTNKTIEEHIPLVTTNIDIIPSEACGDCKSSSENQQEILSAVTCQEVENVSVENAVVSESENRFLNLTEDVSESGVHNGVNCSQVRQSDNDNGSVFSAPVDIIIPKVSFLPTKSISSNQATLAALAKKRIPKRLQSKSHVSETHKMTAVVMQLPQTKPSSSKSISAARLKKLAKKSKRKQSDSRDCIWRKKREPTDNSTNLNTSDVHMPATKKFRRVHFSDVCVEYNPNIGQTSETHSRRDAPIGELHLQYCMLML